MYRAYALILLLSLPFAVAAQKYPVGITHAGEDVVGKMFVFELKEAIRGSHSAHLVEEGSIAPQIRLGITSLDSTIGGSGSSSAMAISVSYDSLDMPLQGVLMTTIVYHCGKDKTPVCAREVLAMTVEQAESLRKRNPSLHTLLLKAGKK